MRVGLISIRESRVRGGFSLIDLLLTLSLLTILAGMVPAVVSPAFDQLHVEQTRLQLLRIRNALVGDPSRTARNARTEFGYLGDLGALPSAAMGLGALLSQPGSVPAYSLDTTVRFGRGWNGPYLESSLGIDWTKDAWGTALIYDPASVPATITSLGADKTSGGSGLGQDLSVRIPSELLSFTLYGFVTDSAGGVYTGLAEAELNDLDGVGAVSTSPSNLISVGVNGSFQFTGVTMGKRSVTVYLPSKGTIGATVIGPVTITPLTHHVIIPTGHLQTP